MKYSLNEDYFNIIDNEEKAYWIGFLWGDCYNNINRHDFKIDLSIKDKNHLEKFKKAINSTHPIKEYEIYNGFKENKTGNNLKEARFYFSNYHFSKILEERYGIIPNRSDFSLIEKNVPVRYYKDIIRGLIDSDGTISCNANKNPREFTIGLIASEGVLNFVVKYFKEQNLINKKPVYSKRHKNRDGNMLNFHITGNIKVLEILIELYNNSDIFLDRKKAIFLNLIEEMKMYYIYIPVILKGTGICKFLKTQKDIKEILEKNGLLDYMPFKKIRERGF